MKAPAWLRRLLRIEDVDAAVADAVDAEDRDRIERALRDPFRFLDRESFVAFRRKHGHRTPRRPR